MSPVFTEKQNHLFPHMIIKKLTGIEQSKEALEIIISWCLDIVDKFREALVDNDWMLSFLTGWLFLPVRNGKIFNLEDRCDEVVTKKSFIK